MEKMLFFDMLTKSVSPLLEEWVKTTFCSLPDGCKDIQKGLLANEIQLDLNGEKKTLL